MAESIQYAHRRATYPQRWTRRLAPGIDTPTTRQYPCAEGDYTKLIIQVIQKPLKMLPANEADFLRLANLWRKDTAMLSSLSKKVTHPAYQRIIGMGPTALPMILREMKRKPGHWFWALDAITQGESPAEGCETFAEATAAWIKWGEAKGVL